MYRRTVAELKTLYRLEPTLIDIWVEGPSDQWVITWYLDRAALVQPKVKTIQEIEIGSDVLKKYGLTTGNRNRLIALTYELDSELERKTSASYLSIVDKDFDEFREKSIKSKSIVYTDFCSMEAYFFDPLVLRKFFQLCLGRADVDITRIMSDISVVTEKLFFARLANESMRLGLTWIQYDRLLSQQGKYVEIDMDAFCERLIQSNGRWSILDDYIEEIARVSKAKLLDTRNQMNGHDLIQLLYWANKTVFKVRADLERALRACLEADYLSRFAMFDSLRKFCG